MPVSFPIVASTPATVTLACVRDGHALGRRATFESLATDRAARAALADVLRASSFPAFFWECAPLVAERDAPFTRVLVDAPALARVAADPAPFAAQLARSPGDVVAFTNLGGDAHLVVPRPASGVDGAHLAAFVRTASDRAVDALLARVGEEVLARRVDPLWVSTSGLGVAWVHVRLDARPKYYSHVPLRPREA